MIVANLPYVSSEELATLAPEVVEHEPRLALEAAEEGLAVYRRLLMQAPAYIRSNGVLIMEIAPKQARRMLALARSSFANSLIRIVQDYTGRDRAVLVRAGRED